MLSNNNNVYRLFITLVIFLGGCKKFVDVELPISKIQKPLVFSDDNTASSAMIGVYYDLSLSAMYFGQRESMAKLTSLSADELTDFRNTPDILEFQENRILPLNLKLASLWNSIYKVVYNVNAMIEGLNESKDLSNAIKSQLLGESRFVRAYCYFQLVNLFGDVPLLTSTDYQANATAQRVSKGEVYLQIISDLKQAEELLPEMYFGVERTRPNSLTASALLAKVYLFMGDLVNAEIKATKVIESPIYEIVANLDNVFLKESKEAIWQIAPVDYFNNTVEASYFVIKFSPSYLILRKEFVESFNDSDMRRSHWIGSIISSNNEEIFFPHKYKLQDYGLPIKEYSIVLRLADIQLIRAEIRAKSDNLQEAIADLDKVRGRTGLPLIANSHPTIDKSSLINAIYEERKNELFTEWCNRWFDLKRSGKAQDILTPLKSDFVLNDTLYPIPQTELNRNPQLGKQNIGY